MLKGITHHHVSDGLKLYYIDFNDQQVHPSRERLLTISHSQNLGSSPPAQVKQKLVSSFSFVFINYCLVEKYTQLICLNFHVKKWLS